MPYKFSKSFGDNEFALHWDKGSKTVDFIDATGEVLSLDKSAALFLMEALPLAMRGDLDSDVMNAGTPWTSEQENRLKYSWRTGVPISKIARDFGRTRGAIATRLKRLGYLSEKR
ncbi:MAG: GcrA family cell cycle regulator [Pseudomonadota bacterium]